MLLRRRSMEAPQTPIAKTSCEPAKTFNTKFIIALDLKVLLSSWSIGETPSGMKLDKIHASATTHSLQRRPLRQNTLVKPLQVPWKQRVKPPDHNDIPTERSGKQHLSSPGPFCLRNSRSEFLHLGAIALEPGLQS